MIVLINPPVSRKAPFSGKVQMGLACLSHYLKSEGIKSKIIDEDDMENTLLKLDNINQNILFAGITALSYQINNGLKIAEYLKKRFPQIVTVFGGAAATGLGKRLFENNYVDIVVLCEGEKAFLDIVSNKDIKNINGIIFRDKNNIIIENKELSLLNENELFLPSRDFFKDSGIFYDQALKKDSILLMFSRGCTGRCKFCMAHKMFPGNVRFVPLNQIIEYIKNIISNLKIKSFVIDDDNFLSSREFVIDFCRNIKALDIQFRINVSQTHFDERLILMLKDCGLKKITVGVESIFSDTQKIIRKYSDVEKIKKISDFCKNNNILLSLLFIAALPYETAERLKMTIDTIKQIEPNGGYDFQVFQPHPGTFDCEELKKYGEVLTYDLDEYFSDNAVFIPNGIKKNELKSILEKYTNKNISVYGQNDKSVYEVFKDIDEVININVEDFISTFEKKTIHWKGSRRCMSGLAMIKALGKGNLIYDFYINKESISDYFLVCRLSSHVEGFPEGEKYSSELCVFINHELIEKVTLKSVHTTGILYVFKISSEYVTAGRNQLLFSVNSESDKNNGLSVFSFALNDFYKKYETGMLLIPQKFFFLYSSVLNK